MQKVNKTKTRLIGVYSIENPEGEYYIGSSVNIYSRWNSHSPKNVGSPQLAKSFLDYGKKNHIFKIVCLCNKEELIKKEIIFQRIFKSVDNGLNSFYANQSARTFTPLSKESIEKMRQSKIGSKLTEDHKNKISLSLLGIKKPPRTKEHIEKIATQLRGKKLNLSDEQREKRRIQVSQIVRTNGKKVICNKTGVIYDTIAKASKENNINEGTLRFWFKNPRLNKSTLSLF